MAPKFHRGRPATGLRLEQNRYAMGVDVDCWEAQFGIGAMRGKIVDVSSVRTPRDPQAAIATIASQFNAWTCQYGRDNFEGVGISMRGIVDSRTGVVIVNIPVKEELEARLQTPGFVENNVRAAALAEYNFGSPGRTGQPVPFGGRCG